MNLTIALGDLHLGHPTTLLQEAAGRAALAHAIDVETYGEPYKMVLLGDVIDLCYVQPMDGLRLLEQMIRELVDSTQLQEVTWIIGNHDFHYFATILEDTNFEKFSDRIYQFDPDGFDFIVPVEIAYPEHFVWHNGEGNCTLFSHGHLLGPDGSLFSTILDEPRSSVESVCSLNYAWLEFAWWNIWQDKRVGDALWRGTSVLAAFMVESFRGNSVARMARYVNDWLVNTRKATTAVQNYVFGHTHQAGEKRIRIGHSIPVEKHGPLAGITVHTHPIRMVNTGAWIVERRIKRKSEYYEPPDSMIVRLAGSKLTMKRVKFKKEYVKLIGDRGDIVHPAEWGLWFQRENV